MRFKTMLSVTGFTLAIFLGIFVLPSPQPVTSKPSTFNLQRSTTYQSSIIQPSNQGQIRDFNLLTPETGWLLLPTSPTR